VTGVGRCFASGAAPLCSVLSFLSSVERTRVSAIQPIREKFDAARTAGRLAFMPFVTAGDPDVATTMEILARLGAAGVDLIEVGFPYSDPIADGPVIQASYTRALSGGTHVADILAGVRELKRCSPELPPLLAMVSYAIMFRHGVESFVRESAKAGFAGFIVPDLPGDEAAECFELVRGQGLDLVQLVAPTTPPTRVRQILEHCSGFVYCLAVAGITGERAQLAEALHEQLRWLRGETDLPLAVGFGISRPEHLADLKPVADGAIVGTALVRHLQSLSDGAVTREAALQQMQQLTESMIAAR
jgi:tryptophan synthase alpha chain